jgi:hypothetical protein
MDVIFDSADLHWVALQTAQRSSQIGVHLQSKFIGAKK